MKRECTQNYIDEIKRQLHLGHASLMVGSGFSRNAEVRSSRTHLPPTWDELKEAFSKRLYGNYQEEYRKNKCKSKTALQLAYEYERFYDRSSLNQFLKEQIQDTQLFPGKLHDELLNLPWRDIFTTNYDTLLERAAEKIVDRKYDTVCFYEDLAFSESPRIIKLHGSMESEAFHLIVTDEDYRTYPDKYAPFVNTVQQAIMETTLCLIGFSGTDPNFQKWIGWVRDNLNDSMPPVYLIDQLNITDSEYNVLIKYNIKPVDISLLGGRDYKENLNKFFQAIKTNSPVEWNLSISKKDAVALNPSVLASLKKKEKNKRISRLMQIWKEQREHYPNWIIMPDQYRQEMIAQTSYWIETLKSVSKYSILETENIQWLYEYNWRIEHCLMRIPSDNIIHYERILREYNPLCLSNKQFFAKKLIPAKDNQNGSLSQNDMWIQLMFAVLRWFREALQEDGFKEYEKVLEEVVDQYPNYQNKLFFEKALFALSFPNLEQLQVIMKEWGKVLSSPEWYLKFLCINAELGNINDVKLILKHILHRIRETKQKDNAPMDYNRLWLEGIALVDLMIVNQGKLVNQPLRESSSMIKTLISSADDLYEIKSYQKDNQNSDNDSSNQTDDKENEHKYMQRLNDLKSTYCDPRDEPLLTQLSLCSSDDNQKQVENKRIFDETSTTIFFGARTNNDELMSFQFLRYLEETGLLQHLGFVSVCDKQLLNAAKCIAKNNPALGFSILNRTGVKADTDYEMLFSQRLVYCIAQDKAEETAKKYLQVVRWLLANAKDSLNDSKNNIYKKTFRNLLEALSRLIVRVSPKVYQLLFDFLIEFNSICVDRMYIQSQIRHFTKRLFTSMPSFMICNNCEKLLRIDFPTNQTDAYVWTNPFNYISINEADAKKIHNRKQIHEALDLWLERSRSDIEWKRKISLNVLLVIFDWKIMSKQQEVLFVNNLFSILNNKGLPQKTDYYPWVFLKLAHLHRDTNKIAKSLLDYYTEYDFSFINSNTTFRQESSFEVTCYSMLVNLSTTKGDPRTQLKLTSRDAWQIYTHIASAVNQFIKEQNNPPSNNSFLAGNDFSKNNLFLDRIIAEIILPRIKDKKKRNQISNLLLHAKDIMSFPSTRYALLLPDDSFPTDLMQDFIAAIASSNRDIFNLYSWAILNAYICAKNGFGPKVPAGVFSSLLNAIGMKTDDTFRLAAQNIAAILDFYEMKKSELGLLLHYLQQLQEETLFDSESSRFPVESRYDYRISAGGLAARLYKTYVDKGETIPEILQEWKNQCHSSKEFPSLRKKWDEEINKD